MHMCLHIESWNGLMPVFEGKGSIRSVLGEIFSFVHVLIMLFYYVGGCGKIILLFCSCVLHGCIAHALYIMLPDYGQREKPLML